MKASPLDEFIARSHARGQCDKHGVATGFFPCPGRSPSPPRAQRPTPPFLWPEPPRRRRGVRVRVSRAPGRRRGRARVHLFHRGELPERGIRRAMEASSPWTSRKATQTRISRCRSSRAPRSPMYSDPVHQRTAPTPHRRGRRDALAAVETRRAAEAPRGRNKKSRWYRLGPSRVEVLAGGPSWPPAHEARVDKKRTRRRVDPTDARAPVQRGQRRGAPRVTRLIRVSTSKPESACDTAGWDSPASALMDRVRDDARGVRTRGHGGVCAPRMSGGTDTHIKYTLRPSQHPGRTVRRPSR